MKLISSFIFISILFFNCQEERTASEPVKQDKPNIILIVVDDQGYADFTPFKNHDSTVETPNIDKLGSQGTVYTQAYVSAPVCSPSRAGILTGKNQFRWDIPASWGPGLPDNVKTLPEYLKEVGYETARIGKNDLGRNFHKYDVREYPLNHGYDEFLGFSAHAHDYWLLSKSIKERTPDPSGTSAVLGSLMHNDTIKSYEEGYLTEIITDESIDYIKRKRENPFFLTVSFNAIHHLIHEVPQKYLDKYGAKPIQNYEPDSLVTFGDHEAGSYSAYYDKYSRVGAIKSDEMRAYYLANLNCLDDNIGKLMEALKSENLSQNTIIVYVSDNGGSPLTGSNNSPLTGGKYSLWEGGIRVPLAVVWPGHVEEGKTVDDYVSAVDIMPTLTNVAGIELNDDSLDGVDLLNPVKDRLLVWKWQKTWAVRKGKWKLTNAKENHWKSEPSDQYIAPIVDNMELKLFDVNSDPGERHDLASENPEVVQELETAFKNWCEKNIDTK